MVYRCALSVMLCAATLAGADGAGTREPAEVLRRVIARLREQDARLPNYTCVETVVRQFYKPLASTLPRSCPVLAEVRKHRTPDMQLKWILTDRLRLDVAMTEHGEIQSWVGASKFEEGGIDQVVRSGPIGTGAFGGFLAMISQEAAHSIRYTGERDRLMEFSFAENKEKSTYRVKTSNSWVLVAYSGTFQADPVTAAVVHVTVRITEMPLATGDCETTTDMELAPIRIGDGEFLLPKIGRQQFVTVYGEEAENTTTFSSCREYRGMSTIRFGPPAETDVALSKADPPLVEIPPRLPFTLELSTPIDPTTAAAGDPFSARLVSALRNEEGRVIAPAHALVQGRLLRVEDFQQKPGGSVMVLRPQTVDAKGTILGIRAKRDLSRIKPGTTLQVPLPGEQYAGVFVLKSQEVVRAGTRSEWVTVTK